MRNGCATSTSSQAPPFGSRQRIFHVAGLGHGSRRCSFRRRARDSPVTADDGRPRSLNSALALQTWRRPARNGRAEPNALKQVSWRSLRIGSCTLVQLTGENVRSWPRTNMLTASLDVRCLSKTGKHLLTLSFTAFDPKKTSHRTRRTHWAPRPLRSASVR